MANIKGKPNRECMLDWIKKYGDCLTKEEPRLAVTTQSVEEEESVANVDDTKAAKSDSEKVGCIRVGCKKRTTVDCINRMCFDCCFNTPEDPLSICNMHHRKRKRVEEENILITEYLTGKPRQDRLFCHHEEKFTKPGQTVVIWCYQDFCLNKRWSEPTFTHLQRQEQRNQKYKKRNIVKGSSKKIPTDSTEVVL